MREFPTVEDLASDWLTHRFGDLFNPPALTNFLGCTGMAIDMTGIRNISFPPFSSANTLTAALTVNRRHFPSLGVPVSFRWFPDRVERKAMVAGLRLESTTVMAVGAMGIQVAFTVQNVSESRQDVEMGVNFQGGITKSMSSWSSAAPPHESDNQISAEASAGRFVFSARHSDAVAIQGVWPLPQTMRPAGVSYQWTLAPGERQTISIFWAAGATPTEASSTYDELVQRRARLIPAAREDWNAELRALFTPHNSRYSGHLPALLTSDAGIQRMYWMGAVGVSYFRRDSPYSVVGRAYDTLMPRYWQAATVLWDYSLSGQCHAMLDPDVMRATLERWMLTDVHTHFGTCYLTGKPIGPWYAVNDYAMGSMAYQYVSYSGNVDWLEKRLVTSGKCVSDFLVEYATNWKQFVQNDGLAGYGDLNNLLECVSSYVHEVASLNAANVYIMRSIAELIQCIGRHDEATALCDQADRLFSLLQQLYVDGSGYWYSRQPNGKLTAVRHAYDLLTVLNTVGGDLSTEQKLEMTRFFEQELRAGSWMFGLSPQDENVLFSVRPDHQWTGAYPAWPAETAKGLFRIGATELALDWVRDLARSANQGPFGQAHFADNVAPVESGASRKASSDPPYINDWHSSSSGSWVSMVIEGLFGVSATPRRGVTADPHLEGWAADAVLENLPYQGKLYRVDRKGTCPV
jgi:hypothetical protein